MIPEAELSMENLSPREFRDYVGALIYKLDTLCHPLCEAMPEGARLTELIKAANEASTLLASLLNQLVAAAPTPLSQGGR